MRATIAGAALVAIVLFRDHLASFEGLAGLAIFVLVYTGGILLLVNRFPAREVGIVATALDMVVVTVAIYIEPQALDAYLFYVPVMLGVALRYGLAASIWASFVMAFMYASVVFLASGVGDPARGLPIRIGYLIGLGAAAGLFARVAIDRATENAELQQRLVEEERESLRGRETELLSQLAREFGTSLERKETTQAIARATAPLLGDVTWLLLAERADPADPGSLRLVPAEVGGTDDALVERLRTHLGERSLRIGEGVVGAAAGTATAIRAQAPITSEAGDPDG